LQRLPRKSKRTSAAMAAVTSSAASVVVNAEAATVAAEAAVAGAKAALAKHVAKHARTSAPNALKAAMASAASAMPMAATQLRARNDRPVKPATMAATTRRAPSVPIVLKARAPARVVQTAVVNAAAADVVVTAGIALNAATARPATRKSRISHWPIRRPWLRP